MSTRSHHQVLAKHGRTFHFASRILPRDARDDSATLYAFCRWIDDLADEATSRHEADRALTDARNQLTGGRPREPLLLDTLALFTRRDIPLGAALELIDGVQSDLDDVRMPNDRALLRYCYRVAGTVGVMMCGVLNVRDPNALHHAVDLGIAMQLTNICRDVLEDLRNARIYLPQTRLNGAGTAHESLLGGTRSGSTEATSSERVCATEGAALASVVASLLQLAESYYRSARAGFWYLPARVRPGIMAAGWMYRAIGSVLADRRYDVLADRAVTTRKQKAAWTSYALLTAPVAKLWREPHDAMLHHHLSGLPGANSG